MRILLISTYELGHQPLHVAWPAAALTAAGHSVRALDLAVEDWDDERVSWAEAVGVSVPMHTAMRLGVQSARRIKSSNPQTPILFYGLYAAATRDRVVGEVADRAIAGEYTAELVEWFNGLRTLEGRVSRPVTISTRRSPSLVPARGMLPPLDKYVCLEHEGQTRLAGYVEGSRGCRHRCRHCPLPAVYDGRYRIVDTESILADIQWLADHGAEHITFGDPDFLNGPAHARRLVEAAHRQFPHLTFDLTVKVEHILSHRSIWREMAERNVVFVVSAFETVNDRILRVLDKGHTVADLAPAVRVLREVGIAVRPSWLPFTPWTELSDLDDIFAFIADQDLMGATDPVQMGIRLLVPEGSLVLSIPGAAGRFGAYDPDVLGYRWESSDPAVDELQRKVLSLAESGTRGEMSTRQTLHAQWEQARLAVGRASPSASDVDWEDRAPGLTESWFCCAEPTELQMAGVAG
ncbi:MAG: CUAEP/CCAEP-tail radical SAM protein [bacterium]|nr:radical SAM protein [Acidimicrobiia bacterium]MCY4649107.1 CUAEP/CCAEP-tail radical SAM protein [bacterium]